MPIIQKVSLNFKVQILYRIMGGILLAEKMKYEDIDLEVLNIKDNENLFGDKKIYLLSERILVGNLKGMMPKDDPTKFNKAKMISYCPIAFHTL